MRYLGIDYGAKRVGLALSDEEGMMAFPYKIIKNDLELVDTIHNVCGQEEVGFIVLGESQNFSGQPNKIMEEINEFKNKLNLEVRLPIYLEKEFMTTIHARGLSTQIGRVGKVALSATMRRGGIKQVAADASAAALILQRYLDKKNNKLLNDTF